MGRKTSIIPKAACARILASAGAKRVSADAAEEFSAILSGIADDIADKAIRIAKHSGRKTVHDSDIRLSVRE